MIAGTVDREERRNILSPRAAYRHAPVPSSPTYRILLAEYRDEVFARLEADLRKMGHSVFRVTQSAELRGSYGHLTPDLVLCHHELSGGSGWMAAAVLQMCYPTARVWLYSPWKSAYDPTWVKMSGIDSVIYYRGDLFRLAQEVTKRMQYFRPEPSRIGSDQRHRKGARFAS